MVDESQQDDQPPVDIAENRFSEWFGVVDEIFVGSYSAIIVPTSRRHIDGFKVSRLYRNGDPIMVVEAIGIDSAIHKVGFCGPNDIKYSGKLSIYY